MILSTGQAMLVDFGLIRVVAHQTERAAGTPGYAAPEVWHSGAYSPAADRYAFGALTWFALTGTAPPGHPAELRSRLAGLSLTLGLPPDEAAQLGSIAADDPTQRPVSLIEWTHLLRRGVRSSIARPVPGGAAPAVGPGPRPAAPTTERGTTPWPDRTGPPAQSARPGRTAGLVAAAVVLALLVGVWLGTSGNDPAPSSPGVPTSGQATPPTSSAPPARAAAPAAPAPSWAGTVRITSQGTDFSGREPGPAGGLLVGGIVTYSGRDNTLALAGRQAPAALWSGSGAASVADCVSAIRTQTLTDNEKFAIPYQQGQGICYAWGNTVLFLRGASPAGGTAVQVDVTKWVLTG